MKKAKTEQQCANCGTELMGKFCYQCGEKRISRKDFALKQFAQDVFEKFTHLDSKLLRSLWLLVSRPGFLTAEYLRGRRKPYMKPLSLFFIINVLYFLSIGFNGLRTFETPLQLQLRNPYSQVVERMLRERLADASEEDKRIFEAKFDHKNHTLAKSMLVLIVPILAAVLWLLYVLRGAYYGEHLVTGLHYLALMLLINMALGIFVQGSLFNVIFSRFPRSEIIVEIGEPLFWTALFSYFTLKEVYRENVLNTLAKAAVLSLLWIPTIIAYRFVVFLATFYSI